MEKKELIENINRANKRLEFLKSDYSDDHFVQKQQDGLLITNNVNENIILEVTQLVFERLKQTKEVEKNLLTSQVATWEKELKSKL